METSWLNNLWFRPAYIFMKYTHLLYQIDRNEQRIKKEGRFKTVREMLAAAHMALAVQKWLDLPVHVQLNPNDPPDFFLHVTESDDSHSVTYVEHTCFGQHPSQTDLAAQLASTKITTKTSYPYHYILLVEVEHIEPKDVEAVQRLVEEKGIEYPIFLMEGRVQDGQDRVHMVCFNCAIREITANIEVECQRFPAAHPAVLFLKSPRTDKVLPPGQPAPWPDPLQ
jgi:hypothetical protein